MTPGNHFSKICVDFERGLVFNWDECRGGLPPPDQVVGYGLSGLSLRIIFL
jgi:hypothetical protein